LKLEILVLCYNQPMSAFRMIRLGNPILRKKSEPVTLKELSTKTFQKFLDKLINTLTNGAGVGIASPQVGISKRIIVVGIDFKRCPQYDNKKEFPLTIVINPKITKESKETKEDWEGDLSADIRGIVPRAVTCTVVGIDREGKEVIYDLQDDFHARVFQHEIDHLDGIMFLEKVQEVKSFSETKMWRKYWKGKDPKVVLAAM